jgi:lipid II:glycine glycyltransferase (peptidoglycan interpeptide bridge formation enzyme)
MSYKFTVFTEELPKDWNTWILDNQRGSVHQVAAWKNLQLTIPGRNKVLGFEVTDGAKKILARCLAVQMSTGFQQKNWWYSARGPVFDDNNFAAAEHLVLSVQLYLRNNTAGMFWRFDPYVAPTMQQDFSSLLQKKLIPSVQNYQPTDTLLLDLKLTEEALKAQMKREGRRNLNRSIKNEITYQVITGHQYAGMSVTEQKKWLDIYWDLNNQTTGRDGFSGHEKSYSHNFLLQLSAYAVLFFAVKDGVVLATALSTFCGEKAIYYFGASSSDKEHRKLCAPYGLQWAMIVHAKTRGCRTYDFLGIAPDGQPNHPYKGITQFKTRFGGYRDRYLNGQELVLRPLWYWGYRLVKQLLG